MTLLRQETTDLVVVYLRKYNNDNIRYQKLRTQKNGRYECTEHIRFARRHSNRGRVVADSLGETDSEGLVDITDRSVPALPEDLEVVNFRDTLTR